MKSQFSDWSKLTVDSTHRGDLRVTVSFRRALVAASCLAGAAIAIPSPAATLVIPHDTAATAIAQALPTPLPPLPTSSSGAVPATGEQYLVLVNGSSDLLLQQVRQVEPGAFVNYVDGRSVIQAGRFSSYQNAQVRAGELSGLGIGAEVQPTDYAGAPIAVAPPADYTLSFPAPGPSAAQPLPTNTVAATPSSIEFGQAAPFQPGTSTSAAFPPPVPTANPNTLAPSSNNVSPPPVTTPEIINERLASGYYVVIPGNASELQRIANQVVALGAPGVLVHTRTAPRGPHVAVGPYGDRGLAQEWNDYLRNSGIPGARLHYE